MSSHQDNVTLVLKAYEEQFYDFLDSTTEYSSVEVQESVKQLFFDYVLGGIERGLDTHWKVSSTLFEVAMAMAINEQLYGESLSESKAIDRLLVRKIVEWSDANIPNGLMGTRRDKIREGAIRILWQNAGSWAEMPIINPIQEWEVEDATQPED